MQKPRLSRPRRQPRKAPPPDAQSLSPPFSVSLGTGGRPWLAVRALPHRQEYGSLAVQTIGSSGQRISGQARETAWGAPFGERQACLCGALQHFVAASLEVRQQRQVLVDHPENKLRRVHAVWI